MHLECARSYLTPLDCSPRRGPINHRKKIINKNQNKITNKNEKEIINTNKTKIKSKQNHLHFCAQTAAITPTLPC